MKILIDMDDVLEYLVDAICEWNNNKFGTSTKKEDVTDWNLCLAFPSLTKEQVYDCEFNNDFWKTVKPIDGADEALKKLISDGHEIFIVSASYFETLRSKMENVLFKYYPFLDWQHVIITRNKQMIKGDVLIDDGPHNLVGGEYEKILFEANHNLDFDEKSIGAYRARTWTEVLKIIDNIDKTNPA